MICLRSSNNTKRKRMHIIRNFWQRTGNRMAVWLQKYGGGISDKTFLQLLFFFKMGYRLDLKNPQSFSEKLQWLKLYNRRPEYTKMVDKLKVKEYVAERIGKEYVIPTLGVWDRPEDIDWDVLPNRFVLKTTHGGGSCGVIICKDKNTIDRQEVVDKLNRSLNQDIYSTFREWPYKNVSRRILAEEFVEPAPHTNDLPDYKLFCFNGEPKYCQVISGRGTKMCIDFFDKDWNHQPFHEPREYPFADLTPQKPKNFEIMWREARKLAVGEIFVRVDFYDVDDKVLFGEVTFFPTSGMGGFSPKEFDNILGSMISLPRRA